MWIVFATGVCSVAETRGHMYRRKRHRANFCEHSKCHLQGNYEKYMQLDPWLCLNGSQDISPALLLGAERNVILVLQKLLEEGKISECTAMLTLH